MLKFSHYWPVLESGFCVVDWSRTSHTLNRSGRGKFQDKSASPTTVKDKSLANDEELRYLKLRKRRWFSKHGSPSLELLFHP